jgi:mRNA interferase MazF
VKRGEVWTAAAGSGYAGKPRPIVVVQDDRFDATDSVTVCAMTTDPTDAPLFRVVIEPSERNGLREQSRLMIDKVTTVPRSKLGEHIGELDSADMLRLNRAAIVFLGLAGQCPTSRRTDDRSSTSCQDRGRYGRRSPSGPRPAETARARGGDCDLT